MIYSSNLSSIHIKITYIFDPSKICEKEKNLEFLLEICETSPPLPYRLKGVYLKKDMNCLWKFSIKNYVVKWIGKEKPFAHNLRIDSKCMKLLGDIFAGEGYPQRFFWGCLRYQKECFILYQGHFYCNGFCWKLLLTAMFLSLTFLRIFSYSCQKF